VMKKLKNIMLDRKAWRSGIISIIVKANKRRRTRGDIVLKYYLIELRDIFSRLAVAVIPTARKAHLRIEAGAYASGKGHD
jgi:hypothetical protein